MKRLIAVGCAIGIMVVAWRQPWLTAASAGGFAAMDGTGAWTFAGQTTPTSEAHGWPMQYIAMLGAVLILAGALTEATAARVKRILLGAACSAATALTAMLATDKIAGLPHVYGIVTHTGSAPKVIIALCAVAAFAALTVPVPLSNAQPKEFTA